MATRHMSLLEQKKMQWAKEREEMAGLCTPWGPTEKVRPLRKRLAPNLPEDPNEDYQSRDDDSAISVVPPLKEIYSNHQVLSVPGDSRGRTPRARSDPDSISSNLPPVNQNINLEQPRRTSLHRTDVMPDKHERYDNYEYLNNSSGLSKSTENFSISESDPRMKRKPFLSGDRVLDMGSYEKMPTDRSLYSSSYQLRNSNLSLATDGDATWREWGMGRGNMDEMRPRWGDRGINTGQPWNPGGPGQRIGDNQGGPEEYPTPGWVERGLSRMSGDGRGRGSAESPRNDTGIRVIVSDESGGVQRMRGSVSDSQNLTYIPGARVSNENYPPRNYDGYSSALPYVGEMQSMHSSVGMHPRHGGSVIEDGKGERMFVAERDVCNASDISHSGHSYGYNGCISAPNNHPPSQKFKKNDDVTASLPNLQSTSTHLRGQNVPVDPEVIVEREMRRLKAMELQKAIRQQLEEREKIRLKEKELRMKEEREIEERLMQQQEAERLKKEEEDRKHREKEEMENKKAEIMREALEAAEQDAQKQRKKRSGHRMEEKILQSELNKDYPGIDVNEQNNNFAVSSCCPILTEGAPKPEPAEGLVDDMGRVLPVNTKLEGGMTPGGRLQPDYLDVPYHSATTPVAPFKISIPESSMPGGLCDVGGDCGDLRQGGVLIVGRDVYLLPYVNTDVLAPRQFGGSTFTVGPGGGIESIGNGILGSADQYDFRRDWIGGNQRVRPSKDVGTQTEPSTQGPLLLLLRVAGPDDSQAGSEQRSSADDCSIPDNEKEGKGKAYSDDAGTASNDCCFCQKTRSQSQPSCSKGSSQDCQQKQPQQLDQRPKWGANRPTRRYTTQSEKDPHYSCRCLRTQWNSLNLCASTYSDISRVAYFEGYSTSEETSLSLGSVNQKRQAVGRSKREVSEAEEGSEDAEQISKPQVRVKSKAEMSVTNASASGAPTRNTSTRKKKESSKKKSDKPKEAEEPIQQAGQHVPQSPLPVLVPPRTIAPKRVQVVKPSLSLDQELLGNSEYQIPEIPGSRAHLPYFSPQQFSPMQMFPDCKHLPPPVLSPHQRSALSPTRFTQMPMAPIRLSPSPTPPIRVCPTPMPSIQSPHSPMPTSRHTQTPLPPSPPLPPPSAPQPPPSAPQPPPRNNRNCGSPPVPAVLSKLRREQAKSPPRQFSFISTAPEREKPPQPPQPPPSRKESRSGTPLLKPQSGSSKLPSPRVESRNAVVVITPSDDAGRKSPVSKPKCSVTKPLVENNALLTTPRENISRTSYASCPSRSSALDNSNALMMVTSTEDISVGSPVPHPLFNSFSMVEVDGNGSVVLVTQSDEISVGVDSRSNVTLSRASQISAEGIPDGFWEDFESSAQISSSLAEVSVAASIPEDVINEQKVKGGSSARCMEQGDESVKQTGSKELGSNINQAASSSERQSRPKKSEGYSKDNNNGQKELEEEMVEAKNSSSITPSEKDNNIIDPSIAAKNGGSLSQELKKDIGENIGEEPENITGSVGARHGENRSKKETDGKEGEATNQAPKEGKSLDENKIITPDIGVERKQSQEVDVNSEPSATIPVVDESSFERRNEDFPNALTLAPEAELVILDQSVNKDINAMTELEINYSSKEEKTEVGDVAKLDHQEDSPKDCKDEKEITSEEQESPRIAQGGEERRQSPAVAKGEKEILSEEKASPRSAVFELKEANVEEKALPEVVEVEKETVVQHKGQSPRVTKNVMETNPIDKELSPRYAGENKRTEPEVKDISPIVVKDEITVKPGIEGELSVDSNDVKETKLIEKGSSPTHQVATDASMRRDSDSSGKVQLAETKCDGGNVAGLSISKIEESNSGDPKKKK